MKNLILILITSVFVSWSVISLSQCGWELQNTGQIAAYEESSIFFIDSLCGWVAGGTIGTIARTVDGGVTWAEVYNNPDCYILNVHFINNNEGWAVGGQNYYLTTSPGIILQSFNGGVTWDTIYYGLNNFYSVHFFDENTGLVAGYNKILKTTNGGSSWQYTDIGVDTSFYNFTFKKFQFLDGKRGWVKAKRIGETWFISSDDFFLKTTDNGNSWDYIPYPEHVLYGGMNDYYFLNENTGWATSSGLDINNFDVSIIYKTTNGGNDWSIVHSTDDLTYNGIHFIDELRGWVLGDWLYTKDGGANWTSNINPECGMNSTTSGQDIFFLNENKGWIVEGYSKIWITNSGGLVTSIESTGKQEDTIQSIVVFPNPFSIQATIKFSLAERKHVTISLLDISGKYLETILSEKLPQGNHLINWDAKNLQPGMYNILMGNSDHFSIQKVIISR